MKDSITLKFTRDEMSYLLLGAWAAYQDYKSAQDRFPYPPTEVAHECRDRAYRLYRRIKKAYDEVRKEEEVLK